MATARMTQAQLVRHLAERCQVNNKAARQFLDELAKTVCRISELMTFVSEYVTQKIMISDTDPALRAICTGTGGPSRTLRWHLRALCAGAVEPIAESVAGHPFRVRDHPSRTWSVTSHNAV